jgi:hypothetical protein
MTVFNPRVADAERFKEVDRLQRLINDIGNSCRAITASLMQFKVAHTELHEQLHRLECAYAPAPSKDAVKDWLGLEIARTVGSLAFVSWLSVPIEALAAPKTIPPLSSNLEKAIEAIKEAMAAKHDAQRVAEQRAITAFEAIPADQREEPFLTTSFVEKFTQPNREI